MTLSGISTAGFPSIPEEILRIQVQTEDGPQRGHRHREIWMGTDAPVFSLSDLPSQPDARHEGKD